MSRSWLCPTEQDRGRIVDANARVRMIRKVGSSAVGVALVACAPWLGWWTLILFSLSALNFLSVDRRMARSEHPERVSMRAIMVTEALIASGVVLSGGSHSPALMWLVLPAGMVAARFRPQVVLAGMAVTVAVILAVTFGVDFHATLHDPVPVITTLALLVASVSIVWAIEAGELHQRGEATLDPLTGLANRRQLSEDLASVWRKATPEHPVRLLTFDLDGFKAYNDTFGHPGGDSLLRRLAQSFKAAVGDYGRAYRLGGDEFCALLWGDCGEQMVSSCLQALSAEGKGFSIRSSFGSVMAPQETVDPDHALQLADKRMYSYKDSGRASASSQTRDLALQVVAVHEPELHKHAEHVAELTEGVARRLGLSEQQQLEVVRAAELHDIGKVAIPFEILHKAGPLDEHEWALMARHPTIGARVLSAAPALTGVAEIVSSTHERYDGTGYPLGLAGEAIPLAARIVFVCDSYDAMISKCPYGQSKSEEEALAELRRCAGSQFDPRVVAAFLAEHGSRQTDRAKREGSASASRDGEPVGAATVDGAATNGATANGSPADPEIAERAMAGNGAAADSARVHASANGATAGV
ncbi:MAG TPA: HD domain-containing phosphohydrolase [Solirubrobacteraceae bacterium]|nr:HD domain-containing phosphohydrolase [Solirubrobacteraceae bacterium]